MLKLLKKASLLITVTIAVIGCSTKVPVNTTVNMPSKSGVALKHLSIKDFSGRKYGISGNDVSNKIKGNILNEGYIAINSNSPVVLVGEISPSRVEKKKWREKHEGKKETWYSYHASIKQSMKVNYSVYHNRKALTSGSESFSYEKEKRSSDGYTEAQNKLRTEADVANILATKAASYITEEISPYQKNIVLDFLKGDDSNLELGIDYVKRERLKQAFNIFDQISNNTPSIEDQAKAIHNNGLVKLMDGEHAVAFELIAKANLLDPKNMDILDSMKRVENYKINSDAHKAQTGK